MQTRSIKKLLKAKPVMEGAGVYLKRAFGYYEVPQFDPFLMMDDFRNDQPSRYLRGFPWHPHRGIETITYIQEGSVEHGDSLGNKGTLSSGDVQWMTAGSGIIHQEMPKGSPEGKILGFQLWANLPASHKMMTPRYQDVKSAEIPLVTLDNGVTIRLICGEINGTKGPVRDIIIDPEYLDITVPPGTIFRHPVKTGHKLFIYVTGGRGYTGEDNATEAGNETIVLYEDGDQFEIQTKKDSVSFLLISGKPLNQPIAWGGPIVMNTQDEVDEAFEEFRTGRFIKG
jgi:redox-sensitive bicupin YhaK (pirin superfamily)